MFLELIKVTKDLRQDGYSQFMPPENWKKGQSCVGYSGDLTGWIEHFKAQGVKTYLRYGVGIQMKGRKRSGRKTCALYREVLSSDRTWLDNYPDHAENIGITELSSVEQYVYPGKGKG